MGEEIVEILQKFFMFCPNCREKVKAEESAALKQIVRQKAKKFASNYDLQKLIEERNFEVLDVFQKFKKLEDNCKFCPKCQWSPFNDQVANSLFKKFKIDFSDKIKKAGKAYLLDQLFPNQGKVL